MRNLLFEGDEHFNFAAPFLELFLVRLEDFLKNSGQLFGRSLLTDAALGIEVLEIEFASLLFVFFEVVDDEVEMAAVVNLSLSHEFSEHATVLFDDGRQLARNSKQQISYLLLGFGEAALLDNFQEDLSAGLVFE